MLPSVRNRIHDLSEWLRASENSFLMFSSGIIGLLAGFGALGFNFLIKFFTRLATGHYDPTLVQIAALPWWHILLALGIGGAIVGPLIHFFAREARGHGVPEVMDAVALNGGKIRPRVVIVKTLVSAITLGVGGSVGREGPIVQIGSAIGSLIGQLLRVSTRHLRILVACGAAAGIAATFNAPIAGVVFAVEIILGSYAITTLTPLVLSSVLATVVSRMYEGDYSRFTIPSYHMVHPFEILPYVVLAILCGVLALGFARFLYKVEDLADAVRIPEWLKTPLGLVAVGGLIVVFPDLYGVGYETVSNALRGQQAYDMLLALALVKILATSITLAAGGSGGVFAPSLFIGATFGGAYGHLMQKLFPGLTGQSGAYAVVGMAAMVAGATHAPLTAFLIIFEMTADYQLILPLMIGSILASYVAALLSKDSIYTLKLSRRGVDLSMGMEVSVMQGVKVEEVMYTGVRPLRQDLPFEQVIERIMTSKAMNHYVVDSEGRFMGVVTAQEMKEMLLEREALGPLLVAADVADSAYASPVRQDATLAQCMGSFTRYVVDELPVVDDTNHLLGTISRRDVLVVYNREIMHQGAAGMKFIHRKGMTDGQSGYVDIPEGMDVRQLTIPPELEGKTLAELNLRKRFEVTVVAIGDKKAGRAMVTTMSDPKRPLEHGERLIVVGAQDSLADFATYLLKLRRGDAS